MVEASSHNDAPEALSVAAIRRGMVHLAALSVIEVAPSIDSTSDELARRARTRNVHGHALLAEEQTAGRGRRGKRWVSPPSCNVYVTLAWQFELASHQLAGLSLAVGAAIASALEAEWGVGVQLKWPNDLYLDDKKLGGVLVDVIGAADATCLVLVGLGLNIAPASTAPSIDQPIADLASAVVTPVSRNKVASLALDALAELLGAWAGDGFARWRDAWEARDWLRGRPVRVSGAERFSGVAVGVSPDGALLVDSDGRVRALWGGEISVRPR